MKKRNLLLIQAAFFLLLLACSDDNKPEDTPTDDCINTENVFEFTHDGKKYEIVKEKKRWFEAAECAVQRGGYLAEINTASENGKILNVFNSSNNFEMSETVAPDGGDGSYLWIGGNDFGEEGIWVWNGNADDLSTQFWFGKVSGMAINGAYTNWGHEPDDFQNSQDALGYAISNWPLGSPGQWNDISSTNKLYFIVEYD